MLLTRLPLMAPERASSLDLHALSAPLAFILSQDQTLRLIFSNSSELPVCVRCSLLFPVTIQLLRSPLPTVKPMPCAPALRIGLGNFQVSPPAVLPALFCLERLLVYHTRALPSRALPALGVRHFSAGLCARTAAVGRSCTCPSGRRLFSSGADASPRRGRTWGSPYAGSACPSLAVFATNDAEI